MSLITRFEDIQAWQEARKAAFDSEYITETQLKEHDEQARKTKALSRWLQTLT